MRFKRLLLLVCLMLWPAMALAQTTGIANQVPVLYISDAMGPADALMDDNAGTAWYGAVDTAADTPTWTLLVASRTVKEIWVRNGAHDSPQSYLTAGRPAMLAVTVYYENQQVSTYRYLLSDAYAGEDARNWVDGYQRLLLPQAMNGVFCIELRVLSVTGGGAAGEAAVSDILLSSGQPSPAASGRQMLDSAPTVWPDATQPPVSGNQGSTSPTRAPQSQGQGSSSPTVPPTSGQNTGVAARLLQRIATRTGPGTGYDEVGSFFGGGEQVQVISKVWDPVNELHWDQVDFYTTGGKHYRAYCVHELRVDIDPSLIPDDPVGVSATILERTGSYFGPGTDYVAHNDEIASGVKGSIYGWENGFVLFEWRDYSKNVKRRAWIPETAVTWDGKQ